MPNKHSKDIISKNIIKELIIKDIAKYILHEEIGDEFEFLDKEFERIESRRADIVLKVKNSFILHIELQSSYEKNMPYRMLRYWLDIKEISNLPIKQYVINLSSNTMPNSIKELCYSYKNIDIKELDCHFFLSQDIPQAVVLAILCDFKGKNPTFIIENIIKKLKKLSKTQKEFREYIIMTEELSGLRKLKKVLRRLV